MKSYPFKWYFGTSVLSREAVLFSEGPLYEVTLYYNKKGSLPNDIPPLPLPQVGKVWNFVGSTAGVLVLYIYPAACYLRLRYVSNKAKADRTGTSMLSQYNIYSVAQEGLAWFIFGLGLILLVVENYQAIKAVVDGGGGNSTTNATSVGVCNLFCAKYTPLNNETLGIMMEF